MTTFMKTILISVLILMLAVPALYGKMKDGEGTTSWVDRAYLKPAETSTPNAQNCSHRVGNVFLTITNYGFFGAKFWQDNLRELYCAYGSDREPSGLDAPSFEFPAGSGINYLFQGALWFAAIVDEDTLCSVGADGWQWIEEMWPAAVPDGSIIRKSNRQGSEFFDSTAISEEDYYSTYTDTLTDQAWVPMDPFDNRPHMPMNIEVNQRSYSWSYKYAEDFILIDFMLRNIGMKSIRRAYMGLYIDADIWAGPIANDPAGYEDDYSGYKVAVPSASGGGLEDTINIAWTADNDGNPVGGAFNQKSPIGVAGTRVVRSPNPDLEYSFNWWTSNGDNVAYDWGPMMTDKYRDFGTGGLGTPSGDKNKYFVLSNNEFDYDQLYAAKDYSAEGWLAPPPADLAQNIANGFDTRYLFSFGPFNIEPDDSLLITIAYVAGDNFHVKPNDFASYYSSVNPDAFYEKLDFTDLSINATWAAWMYDNPGVDTDGDGDSGECRLKTDTIIQGIDTTFVDECIYYQGDGVPDFKGPPPPPSPQLRYTAVPGQITIKWNGLNTENYLDDFSQKRDFEGYRVYMGEDLTIDAFALLTSHDLIDFNRYIWDAGKQVWLFKEIPFSLETLRAMYGEDFNPLDYSESNPFEDQAGILYYFETVDFNQYFADPRGIKKTYAPEIALGEVTADTGYLDYPENYVEEEDSLYHKYYEYYYVIDNLRPSQWKYMAVTAFDFGNPENGLEPLESSPLTSAIKVFPIYSADQVVENNAKVAVYPNPYRTDAGYQTNGYEGDGDKDRERRINFINLPAECTIKIWTTDGDLVREINHGPDNPTSDTNSKAYWDLITRNTQAVVSGIYIYSIESKTDTQIGKIVIIK